MKKKIKYTRYKRYLDYLDIFDNKISKLNNKILKIEDTIKNNKNLTNTEKNELQNKINELTTQKKNNNEHIRAVNKTKKLKSEKKEYEESYEELREYVEKNFEEKKNDFNGFDENDIHKDTGKHYDPNGFDKYGNNVYDNRKKTSEAKSFKDQKGKGYVDLPIALSKIYTNNSSKELINNIEQLINGLYDNKQITKQVYNNLIKAITYVQSTNVYDIYK